jgi:OmpA-OmpF porin, OOP family
VAGVASDDPDRHGCPPDGDGDGIVDTVDACPDIPGEASVDSAKNGCPPDRDEDGVPDAEDACPDQKGIKSADPKQNGCPADSDGDGIPDDLDACPKERGQPHSDPQQNGCPKLVRVTEEQIVILQQVQFATGSAVILPESDELLAEVASVLRQHPTIKKLEVQGHTDTVGTPARNKALSQRRAESVVKWLVERGEIDASRLAARGYGQEQPIEGNDTAEGRQKNRRVQFQIIEKSSANSGGAE